MLLSTSYSAELSVMEGLQGKMPGTNPVQYTWYYDDIGVATIGNGHALVDFHLQHIRRGEPDADARATQATVALGFGGASLTLAEVAILKTKDMDAFAKPVSGLVRADTTQPEFDALVDFAYNVGAGALQSSTLLRLHNSGNALLGPANLSVLASESQNHAPIHSIGEAFAAWSNADHTWTRGVFHRRMWEFLVYSGVAYQQAYSTAFAF